MSDDFLEVMIDIFILFSHLSISILFACIIFSIINVIISYRTNGVATVDDLICKSILDCPDDRTVLLTIFIFWPVFLVVGLASAPFVGIYYILKFLLNNCKLNFIYDNLDKEVISSKSYKVKKLLYGQKE